MQRTNLIIECRTANTVLPKAGLNGFDWTFVQGSTFVLRLNFGAKNPRLRQYPNRYKPKLSEVTMFDKILLCILFFVATNFPQTDYLDIYKKSKNIYSGMFFSNYENEINEPYNWDVYGYFNLDEKYNTPLKRKNFEKSIEYNKLLDSLKIIKKQILNKWYNVETGITFGHNYDLDNGVYIFNGIKEYNSAIIERGYLSINGVYFPQLNGYYAYKSVGFIENVSLRFRCDENLAVKLEEINDVKLVFFIQG